ncbi:MAG TPA: MATE family efflux transporter [Gemmatimonadales bacterium]|nr:MATE family efflux transporter [Gemmatimonadales bacterium]
MSEPVLAPAGRLTTGALRPTILRLAAPTVAMMAFNTGFYVIDSMWVGRLIGPAALAAVSTAGFTVWVMFNLAEMLDVGVVALAARRHGARAPEEAARVAAAALFTALIAGLAATAAAFAVLPRLFQVMRVPADVALLGHAYLHTWLLGAPLVFGFFALEATFRSSGDTKTPFLVLAGSVILSMVLDPLLILGLGPFPRLGVEGAALASVMVRGVACLVLLGLAFRRGHIRLRDPDWSAAPKIIRIGLPYSTSGILFSLVYIWLTRFTSRFGTPALAALGVGHKVEGVGFVAITGFTLAAAALVGQSLGAGDVARARRATWHTVGYALMVTTCTALACLLVPRFFVGLFTMDPQVIANGTGYLRIIAMAQVGQTFELILEGALAGAGYTFWPMVWSSSLTFARIPLAAWWSGLWGVTGIWWAISLTATLRGVAMTGLWIWGGWRPRTAGVV